MGTVASNISMEKMYQEINAKRKKKKKGKKERREGGREGGKEGRRKLKYALGV